MQAKDIDPECVLAIVEELRWTLWPVSNSPRSEGRPRWVFVDEVRDRLPVVPPWKVMLAKLRAMKRQKMLSGCFCGCRGDIELPDHDMVTDRDRAAN